ncbi:DUF2953 domain-containing protein [Paenibacillus beijingensis]|uniref:DUF2953 domain-containing protein n=1 Tax=Paenibacillus beijingensis TaxID=1126833 RepID=UPI00130ED1A0|nr:DUF2953 domain-containing protein [Paenibacillus beijingensis]
MLGYLYGWIITLVVLLLLAAALMTAPIRIRGEIRRVGSDDDMEFSVRALFGLIYLKKRIPILRFTGTGFDFRQENDKLDIGGEGYESLLDRIDVQKMTEMIENSKKMLLRTEDLTGWIRQMLRRVNLKEWKWNTSVGVDDAMWTAMITGMIWSLKTTSIGVISQLVRLTSTPLLTVEPDYRRAHFSTEWSCIAQIRFGYAILAGLQLLLRMKRAKGGVKLWQNILFKA